MYDDDNEIEPYVSIHDQPLSLARSLGFDDQEEFDDYCDEQERKAEENYDFVNAENDGIEDWVEPRVRQYRGQLQDF